MENYYRINVSLNGKYLFATEQGGITGEAKAREVFKLLKEKFPEEEGYKVDVTSWESAGRIMTCSGGRSYVRSM